MAMPISSMVAKFRDEFEAHIEAARERSALTAAEPVPPPLEMAGVAPDTGPL